MSQTDSETEELAEVKAQLQQEIEQNRRLQVLIGEKESEANCAVAWAQTASDTVAALEEQFDEVEAELDKTLEKLKCYENGENPWSLKEESFRQVLQQLNESQKREEEMYQQAEEMHMRLREVQEKLTERDGICTMYEAEITKLKGELSAGERQVSEMVSEFSNTASTWERYHQVKGEMNRTLGNHLATVGMNGDNGAQQSHHQSIEIYRLQDQVHELEQLLAQVQTEMLEERNNTAKLREENETLHKQLLKLQEVRHYEYGNA